MTRGHQKGKEGRNGRATGLREDLGTPGPTRGVNARLGHRGTVLGPWPEDERDGASRTDNGEHGWFRVNPQGRCQHQ